MADTIFTKIIRGEIPSHKVYEDQHVFAFLDINPLSPGHTLVVPKEPAATIESLSDEAAAALGRALPKVCRAVARATRCPAYNVLANTGKAAGQLVEHLHFHIIPKPEPDPPSDTPGARGLVMRWETGEIDPDEAAALASDIAAAINQ